MHPATDMTDTDGQPEPASPWITVVARGKEREIEVGRGLGAHEMAGVLRELPDGAELADYFLDGESRADRLVVVFRIAGRDVEGTAHA